MNRFFNKAALLVVLASISSIGQAQSPTASVTSGTTTIQLDPNFVAGLAGLGATMIDLHSNPLPNNTLTLPAVTGVIDTMTLEGEVEHTGGVIINANGNFLRFENFTLDNTNPAAPVVTADFIIFNRFQSRIQLFNLTIPNGQTVSSSLFQENGMTLTLASATAMTLNTIFGGPILQPGMYIGTANLSANLAPAN